MRGRLGGIRLSIFFVWGMALVACTALVGVEDLHESPRPTEDESAGGSQAGSQSAGRDGVGGQNKGDASSVGGSVIVSGGRTAGSGALSGSTGDLGGAGGTESPGDAGAGGTGLDSPTVNGWVIDLMGHRVPNIPVTIGNTTVLTDTQGRFSIQDVPAEYDVQLIVEPRIGGRLGNYGWVYQGLTRRDPTLQVYRGLAEQNATAHITSTNGTFGDPSTITTLAFGGPDGNSEAKVSAADLTQVSVLTWYGPNTTVGRAHALRWTIDANDLPTAYQTYVEQMFAATSGETAEIPITFPATLLTSAAISGTVTSPTTNSRLNLVFLRFTSNAAISLVEDWTSSNAFSYVAPSLSNSVITLAAVEGDRFRIGPYAMVHKDVVPGTSNIALTIPSPPVLLSPAPGVTGVSANQDFQWEGASKVFLFRVHDDQFYKGIYVFTARKKLQLPVFGNRAFFLNANARHFWNVEIHGDWQSVDSAAGPDGFQDSFGFDDSPVGSRRGDGTYTQAGSRSFTTE